MGLYNDSEYEIEKNLERIHTQQLNQLGEAGTWGTGKQRIAIAARARQISIESGLLELSDDGSTSSTESLSPIPQ